MENDKSKEVLSSFSVSHVPPWEALNSLGEMCLFDKDYMQAMEQFRKAAEGGDPEAQKNIARLYSRGWGVTQDAAEARKWFDRAEETKKTQSRWFSVGTSFEPWAADKNDYLKVAGHFVSAFESGVPGAVNTLFVLVGKAATDRSKDKELEQELVKALSPVFSANAPRLER